MSNTRKTTNPGPPESAAALDLDAFERDHRHEPFYFRLGGRWFQLPHMRDVDRKVLRDAVGDTDAAENAIRRALGEQDYKQFDAIPLSTGGYDELFRQWLEHSGMKPGESEASTGS